MNSQANPQIEATKKKYDKWVRCSITNEKVIIPALVCSKQSPDSDVELLRTYEFSSIMQHKDNWEENRKPGDEKDVLLDPSSRQPIERAIIFDADKFADLQSLAKQAREHNIIDERTYRELEEKFLIGRLHYYVLHDTENLWRALTDLRKNKRMHVVNIRHYASGLPLMHEVIKQSSSLRNLSLTPIVFRTFLSNCDGLDFSGTSDNGMNCLMQAAKEGCIEAFASLIDKVDVNTVDGSGNTVLKYIIDCPMLKNWELMFRMAIDKGVDVLHRGRGQSTYLSKLVILILNATEVSKETLTRSLQYVAEKQPNKFLEQYELFMNELNEHEINLFILCINSLDLEAAQAIALTGYPINSYIGLANERQTVLHYLAKESIKPYVDAVLYNRLIRMMEFLFKLGMYVIEDAAGVSPESIVEPHPSIREFGVGMDFLEAIRNREWLHFANICRVCVKFDAEVAEALLKGIIANFDATFQYKMCLEIIIKAALFEHTKNGRKLYSISSTQIVSPDRFAIDHNNVIALSILIKLKMLSMETFKLYEYAKLKKANTAVLALLQPDIQPALTRARRNSCSVVPLEFMTVKPVVAAPAVEVDIVVPEFKKIF